MQTENSTRKRSHFLSGLGLMLSPFLVVGAYILWPEIVLIRLAAVAAVLTVGDFLAQAMYAWIFSRGQAEGFTHHFGQFLFIVVVGTVLSIWWGWRSTIIVLLVDGAWQGLAGLLDRKAFESLPPGEE
jgi:tetrahydromethanopterin S-methyltransferase subunit D